MALPDGEIQAGLIARYRADAPLQGLLVGATAPEWSIYDQDGVPTGKVFPYVMLFPITSQLGTALAFGTDAVDTSMQVGVFTQAGGFAQARAIVKQIYKITQGKPLDLSADGFNQFFLLFDDKQELPQEDGITQHIAVRWKLMTQG